MTERWDPEALRALSARIGRGATLRAWRVSLGIYVHQVASGVGVATSEIHRAEDGIPGLDETIDAAIRWLATKNDEEQE